MSSLGRVPPRPPVVVATVKAAPAAVPHAADPSHAAPQSTPTHHHGPHHVSHPHASHAHAHAGHAPHGPAHAPKPRRPPKPRKGRRKNSSGESSDEDELDIGGEDASQLGSTPVSFDGEHQDGGDNHQQGGGDSKREDRTLRARFDGDAGAPGALRRRSTDTAFATNRYHRGLCDVMVGPQCPPDMAARVAALDLALLRATPDVTRIEQGGLPRARANLLAHGAPPPTGADRPLPDTPAGRANCIAVMKELQLQLRRSAEARKQSMAQLEVRQRARTP